ncbi:hypothetical protein [Actinokineospora inagensis]|uniref:hypothetical protein n=1 Tax=Actinokineospora inagensis TaxID=103730 RepID=UPI000411A38B|nr:hypothetical protein [Actinokineospora inagensis]
MRKAALRLGFMAVTTAIAFGLAAPNASAETTDVPIGVVTHLLVSGDIDASLLDDNTIQDLAGSSLADVQALISLAHSIAGSETGGLTPTQALALLVNDNDSSLINIHLNLHHLLHNLLGHNGLLNIDLGNGSLLGGNGGLLNIGGNDGLLGGLLGGNDGLLGDLLGGNGGLSDTEISLLANLNLGGRDTSTTTSPSTSSSTTTPATSTNTSATTTPATTVTNTVTDAVNNVASDLTNTAATATDNLTSVTQPSATTTNASTH